MQTDFETAEWAAARHQFHAFVSGAIHKLHHVFERLVAIEYDAPWRHMRP